MTKTVAPEMKQGGEARLCLHGNEKSEESSSLYRVSVSGKPRGSVKWSASDPRAGCLCKGHDKAFPWMQAPDPKGRCFQPVLL